MRKKKPNFIYRHKYFFIFLLCFSILFFVLVFLIVPKKIKLPAGQQVNSLKFPKLLMIGIDAADWDIINPLIIEGKMPNLASLVESGVSATPKTLNPTISPAIWTTLATGKLPNKHGILNFLSTAKDYEYRFIGSDSRKSKAIWNILSDAGEKVGLFGYWATWPPEKINGYVVSDLAAINPEENIYPDSLKNGIIARGIKALGFNSLQGFNLTLPDPTGPNDENFFKVAYEKLIDLDKLFNTTSLYAFDKEQPTVEMQITGVIDASQHLFLKFHWPEQYPDKIPDELIKKYQYFLEYLYIQQDKAIGEFIHRAGPQTNIIVTSDHGVFIDPAVGFRFKQFNTILAQLGYLVYDESGGIDYTKSKAFECNNNTFDWQRRLCLNVIGRYATGIVPQKDYQRLRTQIINSLGGIQTPEGEKFLNYARPSAEQTSDIEYDIRRDLMNKLIIVNGIYRTFNEYLGLSVESGNHYSNPVGPDGIFVWKGPNIRQGAEVNLRYVDITPNILHALGLPIARDMDGKYIPELFENPTEPKYIETYEDSNKTINITRFGSIEETDGVLVDGNKVYIQSEIKEQDPYDTYCFNVPELSSYALILKTAEHNNKTGIKFLGENNPEISENTDLPHYIKINDLPILNADIIPFENWYFPESAVDAYQVRSPLDLNKPSSVGIWTNTFFTINAAEGGVLRIVAKSDFLNNIGAQLRISVADQTKDIFINTKEFSNYDIPVSKGLVIISFINDEKNENEDRNAYIQNILLLPAQAQNIEPQLYRTANSFCAHIVQPGTTEILIELQDLNELEKLNEDTQSALDFLQHTGEVK